MTITYCDRCGKELEEERTVGVDVTFFDEGGEAILGEGKRYGLVLCMECIKEFHDRLGMTQKAYDEGRGWQKTEPKEVSRG